MLFRLQSLLFRSGFVQNTDFVFIFLLNLGFFSHLTLDFFFFFKSSFKQIYGIYGFWLIMCVCV